MSQVLRSILLPCFLLLTRVSVADAQVASDSSWDTRFGLAGVEGSVNAIAVIGSKVYVGGAFKIAGHTFANNIAMWDGSDWHTLGTGPTNGVDSDVFALQAIGSDLYVGGAFTSAGGSTSYRMAKWDGNSWTGFPWLDASIRPSGKITSFAELNGALFASGDVLSTDGFGQFSFGKWTGSRWTRAVRGISEAQTISSFGGKLYFSISYHDHSAKVWKTVGFDSAGTIRILGDTTNQYSITQINSIHADASGVYAAGDPLLSRFEGSSWRVIGAGNNGFGYSVERVGNELLLGGSFASVNSVNAPRIARWDGSTWHGINTIDSIAPVKAIAGSTFGIIVGGEDVRRLTDSTEFKLDCPNCNGINPNTEPIIGSLFHLGHLYVLTPYKLLKFDGVVSQRLDFVLPGKVTAITEDHGGLYATGILSGTEANPTTFVARWRGNEWITLETLHGGPSPAIAIDPLSGSIWLCGSPFDPLKDSSWIIRDGVPLTGKNYPFTVGDQVFELYAIGQYVYASKLSSRSTNTDHLAQWDGKAWHIVDTTVITGWKNLVPGAARLYAPANEVLDQKTGNYALSHSIYSYDGSRWSPLFPADSIPSETTVAEGKNVLYIAGDFGTLNNGTLHGIAKYDGTRLSPLGLGCDGGSRIIVGDSEVWVIGTSQAGGRPSVGLARWTKTERASVAEIARKILLTSVYPNPANTSTRILLNLNQGELARITLVDVTGREIQRLFEGRVQEKRMAITINTSALTAGTYFYRIESASGVRSGGLTVLR